jgi:hypothetical protein
VRSQVPAVMSPWVGSEQEADGVDDHEAEEVVGAEVAELAVGDEDDEDVGLGEGAREGTSGAPAIGEVWRWGSTSRRSSRAAARSWAMWRAGLSRRSSMSGL